MSWTLKKTAKKFFVGESGYAIVTLMTFFGGMRTPHGIPENVG